LEGNEKGGGKGEGKMDVYEGAVSATMTVNFRFLAAFLRKASTVFECPIVKMNSLRIARENETRSGFDCRVELRKNEG
jgi:hypothetical protein